ncbi:hypothetical protein V6N13_026150 [Hibiscus sabdariffa]|uniref:Benzyl alcohol O-benzoyltransferase n=1 Tax=Hibiscus sabdariffa TaxID=183260 RepID=A0ABR2P5U9_9ROSI
MELLPLPLTSPVFTVCRHKPELVVPARPIPRECILLSDIDSQEGLRYQMSGVHFYSRNSSMQGKDPAKVIREALGQALVFYYPFTGRLREAPNSKLMVDCKAEGPTIHNLCAPCFNPQLPLGYYGNAIGYGAALTTAGKLCQNPVENAVELVKEAKTTVTEEHMRSMIDMLVIKDGPVVLCRRLWLVSDLRRARIEEVDFGWGKAAGMAPAQAFEFMNFYIPYEDGILVAAPVMEIFVKEMHGLLNFRDEATGVC